MQNSLSLSSAREDLFVQRYEWLRKLALQLTSGDEERAADLLHDAYLQFTLARTEMPPVHNVDGYLYTMLRNVYVSQERQTAAMNAQTISIADFDSAELSLRGASSLERMRACEQLQQICRYAIARKESSRIASVLILRFFHDYHSEEIARVCRSSRADVDRALWRARAEARSYLEDPQSLSFIADITAQLTIPEIAAPHAQSSQDTLTQLRQTIFQARTSAVYCLTLRRMRELYRATDEAPLDTTRLAHFVSCVWCLDLVNKTLRLPLLAERYLADESLAATKPQKRSGSRKGGSGGSRSGGGGGGTKPPRASAQEFLRQSKRRMAETIEHKPKELRITANGLFLASQSVSAGINRQTLQLSIEEPLGFIEVTSEQRVRLLILPIELPPAGALEQAGSIELSDGRRIEVRVNLRGTKPVLHVAYTDPTLHRQTASEADAVEDQTATTPALASIGERSGCLMPSHTEPSNTEAAPTEPGQAELDASEAHSSAVSVTGFIGPLAGWWRAFKSFGSWFTAERLLRPLPLTLLLALPLIAALFYLRSSSRASAGDLLRRAELVEARQVTPDTSVRRIINFEERRTLDNSVTARRRIEVWQRAPQNTEQSVAPKAATVEVRRVYDESGTLVAGETVAADGARTIKRRGPQTPSASPSPVPPVVANDPTVTLSRELIDSALLDLSARNFTRLVSAATRNASSHKIEESIEERPAAYVVNYRNLAADISSSEPLLVLVKAQLVLKRRSLRAVEQTLIVRDTDASGVGRERELRFTEASFETHPANAVGAQVFTLDAEQFERMKTEGGRMKENAGAKEESSSVHPSSLIPHPSSIATAELEVEALSLLNQSGSQPGEQVSVARTASGELLIEGVVETDERKNAILRALASLTGRAGIRIEIRTIDEALRANARTSPQQPEAQRPQMPAVVQDYVAGSNTFAAAEELERYFTNKGANEAEASEQAREFARRMLARADRVALQAAELRRLVRRFSVAELRALDQPTRTRLFTLMATHAHALEREVNLLRAELRTAFGPAGETSAAVHATPIAPNDAALVEAVERLHSLCTTNDPLLRRAFAITTGGTEETSALKTSQFRQTLADIEALAAAIAQTAGEMK